MPHATQPVINARIVLHVRVSRSAVSIVRRVWTREDAPSLMSLRSRRRAEKRGERWVSTFRSCTAAGRGVAQRPSTQLSALIETCRE